MLEGKYLDPELQEYYKKSEIFEPLVMVSLGVDRDLSDQPQTVVHMLDKPITIASKEEKSIQIKTLLL